MSSSISTNFLKEREIDVLLVDDEPELLEQAEMFMGKKENDLRIETTTSPEKALEELESDDYDVVVSDYKMPEMNGIEFLKSVRDDLESDILLIIFTGKGEEEISLNALGLVPTDIYARAEILRNVSKFLRIQYFRRSRKGVIRRNFPLRAIFSTACLRTFRLPFT